MNKKLFKKYFILLISICVVFNFCSCSSAISKIKNLNTNSENTEHNNNNNDSNTYQTPTPSKPKEETKTIGKLIQTKVTKITDGDTIYVDAFNIRIRFIGVDCPESGTTAGDQATAFTRSKIPVGTTIWIEQDVELYDPYGRPLMYVWLSRPDNNVTFNDVKTKMLNGILLANHHATAKDYPPNTKYSTWFHKI